MSRRDEQRTPLRDGQGARWRYGARGHALSTCLAQITSRKLASLTTLLALGVTLALPALLLFTMDSLDTLATRSLEGESLTLYLDRFDDDSVGERLAVELRTRDEVRDTRYISRADALATFRENSDVDAAIDALGANPLPGAVVVYPDTDLLDDAAIEVLADNLLAQPGVDRVQIDLRWVRRLQAAVVLAQLIGTLMGGFLLLTTLLVIANTIRLEVSRRRHEREVARLLGANAVFLTRPVIYAGALYGFLGGLLGVTLAVIAWFVLRGPTDELARLYGSVFRFGLPPLDKIGIILLVSIILGVLAALLTLYGPSRQKVTTRT